MPKTLHVLTGSITVKTTNLLRTLLLSGKGPECRTPGYRTNPLT